MSCKYLIYVWQACPDAAEYHVSGLWVSFSQELATQFLTESKCKGIRFAERVRSDDELEKTKGVPAWMNSPQWRLKIDFEPTFSRREKQSWTLNLMDEEHAYVPSAKGQGTPAEIAAAACAIANGQGAEVQRDK